MEKRGYPSVFVVDSNAPQPPLPPRMTEGRQRAGAAQTLLFMLVGLALCGMIIEACFIYHLYQPATLLYMLENCRPYCHTIKSGNLHYYKQADLSYFTLQTNDTKTKSNTYNSYHEDSTSAESSKLIGGEDIVAPTVWPINGLLPSRPVAHLTDGADVHHKKHIMAWSMIADPILYEMDYKDNKLIIQKEGYYYVYSKVFFSDSKLFYHVVEMHTNRYIGGNITLLQSRRYAPRSDGTRSNSYLGGVFHLYKDDGLYVKVSDSAKIDRHKSYENVFGAFMI